LVVVAEVKEAGMLVDQRMEIVKKNRFIGPRSTGRPPTIEFDPTIDAWYMRFRTAKVARTVSEDKPGPRGGS
jgi:hypothetical protein